MSLLFKCNAAEQWQVFGELARQLDERGTEWSRAPSSSGSSIDRCVENQYHETPNIKSFSLLGVHHQRVALVAR